MECRIKNGNLRDGTIEDRTARTDNCSGARIMKGSELVKLFDSGDHVIIDERRST